MRSHSVPPDAAAHQSRTPGVATPLGQSPTPSVATPLGRSRTPSVATPLGRSRTPSVATPPGLALLLMAVAVVAACGEPASDAAPSTPPALPVETLRVQPSDHYTVTSRHVGRVVARRTTELGFTRSDRLVEVLVDEGDRVEAGQALGRLDTSRLEAQRTEWLAQKREVQARLDLARLTLDRRKKLAGKDSISAQRYDEARFESLALEARLASIGAGLDRVDIDLAQSTLEAPFAGAIIRRSADEGAILSPGAPVVSLVEIDAMEVRVGVPPKLAARLRVGDPHVIEIDGQVFEAPIGALHADVNAATRTVTVVLPLERTKPGAADSTARPGTEGLAVRHGALARLVVEERREAEGYWLPITALTESRRGLWGAYVLSPGPDTGVFVLARQELMMLHIESDRAFVRGTLAAGDEVVATGLQRIAPGQRVRRAEQRSAAR